MNKEKQFVDELSPAEVEELMQEAEELALHQLTDPETGEPLSRDVAGKRIERAKAKARRKELNKLREQRIKNVRRRANRDMAKRAKQSKRRANKH